MEIVCGYCGRCMKAADGDANAYAVAVRRLRRHIADEHVKFPEQSQYGEDGKRIVISATVEPAFELKLLHETTAGITVTEKDRLSPPAYS